MTGHGSVTSIEVAGWAYEATPVGEAVADQSADCLEAYRVNPTLVLEHANIERATAQGGYGRRQLYELVQNGADALLSRPGGRIEIVLTESALYCANEGAPIDALGVRALLSSHISLKRGSEIGRFGLGFKSVLGVTHRPEFYSRSGSFAFNADWSAAKISQILESDRYPALRLAQVIDPLAAAAQDDKLRSLMEWATTVVKLPRLEADSLWLSEDVSDFPAEFLLFSPHVAELTLRDLTTGVRRELVLRRKKETLVLQEGDKATSWQVFQAQHVPSQAAKKDAGELADREFLPIIWAVPLEGRTSRGRFWAFFPTEYFTTLSGILNGPWKTNEDRQNLLIGRFNDELLTAAAQLIVKSLPQLSTAQDPGRHLDLIPARGRESPNPADEFLTAQVYAQAQDSPSVPDQLGQLQLPAYMHLQPQGVTRETLDIWSLAPGRPTDWCHPAVETRDRRPRVERLLAGVARAAATYGSWLQEIVADGSVEGSIAAIRIAALLKETLPPGYLQDLLQAPIILTTEGELRPARPGQVFLPTSYTTTLPLPVVNAKVAEDVEARSALITLGIGNPDPSSELRALLGASYWTWDASRWELFWSLSRSAGSAALDVLRDLGVRLDIRVRNLRGEFVVLKNALLPGRIVPVDGSRDASIAIDEHYHSADIDLLRALGASEVPHFGEVAEDEPWLYEYRAWARSEYYGALPRGRQPREHNLVFAAGVETFSPLSVLRLLSDRGRTLYTEHILETDPKPSAWVMEYRSHNTNYPPLALEPPHMWMIRREGRLKSSAGVLPADRCVSPVLGEWRAVLPIADCSEEAASALGLPAALGDVPMAIWDSVLERVATFENDNEIGSAYALAATYVARPAAIRCRVGTTHELRDPTEVIVITTRRELQALLGQETPLVLVEDIDAAQGLVELWGLQSAQASVQTAVSTVTVGPEAPLIDEYPGLRWFLDEADQDLTLTRCSMIRLETITSSGKLAEERELYVDGHRVFWAGPDERFLPRLRDELALHISPNELDEIAREKIGRQRTEHVIAIRQLGSLEEKLLEALGVEQLRRRIPVELMQAVVNSEGPIGDLTLARIALVVYGYDTLREFRVELAAVGLLPPSHWAGSAAARLFVRELGFPSEFAGFESARRDALLEIEGPPELHILHDFQQEIAERMRTLLRRSTKNRAILSLPTGAGKTRIAVEAIVREFCDGFAGTVLWVAQSDELCEQAVQSWSYVWRAVGTRDVLSVSRLWAGNEASPVDRGRHVVVATIDKLLVCRPKPEYAWLREASVVIIDEAHESISPSYTQLLRWLELDQGKEGAPLVGLTATPFRGVSEKETARLVGRYGGRRLDLEVLGDDPYRTLQDMGVLATVRHEVLAGSKVELTSAELSQLRQTRLMPASVEGRLARDTQRNKRLLDSIASLPDDWTVLLFATSVAHAQTMAALLSLRHIPAASISGTTDPGARRHYIEEFRQGRIRVLTNYAVLTQGFDAPAVKAIYVARPTYSPNLYQQMIGRGLRGPLNMGTDECLIVNVEDNVQQFGDRLAFHEFDYLWWRPVE